MDAPASWVFLMPKKLLHSLECEIGHKSVMFSP